VKPPTEAPLRFSSRFLSALAGIVAAALILRIVWIHYWPISIESEGVYYARIAENLLSGRGYAAMRGVGKQFLYPPLCPILIALFSMVTGNSELAGRLMSVVFGSVWVIPLMLIARACFDELSGVITGTLVALSPAAIAISGTVQSEPLYLACQAAGIYFALRIAPEQTKIPCYLAGLSFGLAYLVRPEAAIYVVLTALFIVLPGGGRLSLRVVPAARFVLVFLLTILPYVAWLSVETGGLRFEGKSVSNYLEARAWAQHLPSGEIFFKVDPQLKEVGLSNQSDLALMQQTTLSARGLLSLGLNNAVGSIRRVLSLLLKTELFGGPLFMLLAGVGVMSQTSNRAARIKRSYLVATCAFTILPLLSVHAFHDRFIFPFLTLLFPLAGSGLARLYRSLKDMFNTLTHGTRRYALPCTVLAAGIATGYAATCLFVEAHTILHLDTGVGLPTDDITIHRGELIVKTVGQSIRNFHVAHALVMEGQAPIAFYAAAADWPLPYCDATTALRYIAKINPDFIVLRSRNADVFPYAGEWLTTGIPDKRAELVSTDESPDGKVVVYRWHKAI
jgi:4-amino-4-deoxy-L-arabinose transferase-like glycosyltransferase